MHNLSIIIPAFNSETTLEECLKAVKRSIYQDYELIVVDDGSTDKTGEIAAQYADKVITHESNLGRVESRKTGMQEASAEILVNIDSDVLIKSDALSTITTFFEDNQDVSAVTGMLNKNCPYTNYFSQYKNLYMYYILSKLSENIAFLYGSLYAIRKGVAKYYKGGASVADDTEFGQHIVAENKLIALLKSLEVTHMKKFTLFSWVKNDFVIPRDWGKIFLEQQGWKQLGKGGTGYAHASKSQLLSIMLVPSLVFLILINPLLNLSSTIFTVLLISWLLLNAKFFLFLTKERGVVFGLIKAIPATFLDHLVMATGIIYGFAHYFLSEQRAIKAKKNS